MATECRFCGLFRWCEQLWHCELLRRFGLFLGSSVWSHWLSKNLRPLWAGESIGKDKYMEDLIYTMVLSDGTIIENLRKNGDNYISASKLTADMFEGKLSEVTVKTSDSEEVMENMENMDLVQITEMNGEYWFVLRQFSETELAMAKMSSNIDFLAMMQDVEL